MGKKVRVFHSHITQKSRKPLQLKENLVKIEENTQIGKKNTSRDRFLSILAPFWDPRGSPEAPKSADFSRAC